LLYIVATPIGNLQDISQRALDTFKECDGILCEDTRRTAILLERYGISKPLIPCHKFNEARSLDTVLDHLRTGKRYALVSDAGTPCINDPGSFLTTACAKEGIPFTSIPGPCSLINALVLAAFPFERFQFVGFLSKKPKRDLRSLLFYPGVSAAFESPERIQSTLEALRELAPTRPLCIAREMTKTFEESLRGSAAELLARFQARPPKGEIVLIIGPGEPPEDPEPLTLEECIALLQKSHGLPLKEALKQAARLLKIPKRDAYREIHHNSP
jgi:16S rRNA (cytidine1402-2'-O)-methyltransferase